jgi:hypothetical protein
MTPSILGWICIRQRTRWPFGNKRKSLFTLSSPRCKLPPLRAPYCLPGGIELQGPMIRARIDAYQCRIGGRLRKERNTTDSHYRRKAFEGSFPRVATSLTFIRRSVNERSISLGWLSSSWLRVLPYALDLVLLPERPEFQSALHSSGSK